MRGTLNPNRPVLLLTATIAALTSSIVGCSSDDDPDVVDPVEPEVPLDIDVPDGVETEVNDSSNMGFEQDQPDFED